MRADRPGDADVPPDDHSDRQHDPGGAPAETRTRQEYYSELRVKVSREQSVVASRVAAEEEAVSEEWQEKIAESRWMWSEYQRKWPPTERPAADRSLDSADNSRVDAECDRIAKREEDKISPAMRAIESQDPDRCLVGFEDRLKGHDRIKEKVYDGIKFLKHAPEEAVSLVPDTIRYTLQYRDSRYTQGVWTDIERLRGEGFELHKLKNYWSDDQYRGINSTWIEPDTGQRFEVQFHTRISFEAKQLTHTAYERVRSKQADSFEELVLDAFQKKVAADVPVPPGAADIPDYRKEA
ncbi:MAG TPA: hypothetical protein VKU77_33990 [Streptosporangiaceae bacterium]|nr:hypothetical protein [Streptosporangiaceae bacterium]